jgi:hypothetical protein
MPHNHIDSQQQSYGEKHDRFECDAAQPGHSTMMNLPFIRKVEQPLAESDQQNLGNDDTRTEHTDQERNTAINYPKNHIMS